MTQQGQAFQLWHWQEEAVKTLVERNRFILAWDVGVGKTAPAITRANSIDGATLYVVPAYLVPQWRTRIQLMIPPEDEVAAVTGTDTERQEGLSLCGWTKHFVCGYETFRDKFDTILKVGWKHIVFDEAHRLRGRGTQWTQKVVSPYARAWKEIKDPKTKKVLRREAIRGIVDLRPYIGISMLTGTLQMRDGGDWYMPLRICNPDVYTSYWSFVEDWCVLKPSPWGPEVQGVKPERVAAFQKLIGKYADFKALDDVFTGDDAIPPSEPVLVDVPWTPTVRLEYYQVKSQLVALRPEGPKYLTSGGALVAELRRISSQEPNKLKTLKDIANGHEGKLVVWTWHREVNAFVTKFLRETFEKGKKPRRVFSATGDEDIARRLQNVAHFRSTNDGILVAGLPALQEGIDLQDCNVCVFYEHDWLGSTTEQAVGRMRRPGQRQVVLAYSLVIPRCVDAVVYRSQLRRTDEARLVKVTDRIKEVAREG